MARWVSFFTVLLFATIANASLCPSLGGIYECTAQGKTLELAIRDLAPGHYVLEDSIPVRADSVGVTEVSEGLGFRIVTTSTCIGGNLQVLVRQFNAETSKLLSTVFKNYQRVDTQNLLISLTAESSQQKEHLEVRCVRR